MNSAKQSEAETQVDPMPGRERRVFLLAVVIVFLVTVAFHLVGAKKGWHNYRDQHIGAALEYAKGRIDLLRPMVVGFNAGQTPTLQELPLWQALAGGLLKTFGLWFGWANVASLLFAAATIWPVYQLAKASAGERAAWWTLLFFLTQPLIFYMSGRGGVDGSCLTFTIWFVYFADRLVRTGEARWLAPAAVFAALSAVTKAPFFFCAGLTCFFLLLVHGRRSLARWAMLVGVGVFAVVMFKLWTHHCDAVMAKAEFPLVDLRISAGADGGEFFRYWLFGDLKYRLNPANWVKGGWRFLVVETGSFALSGLLIWGLFRSRNRLGQLWMLAGLLTTLVFTPLVLHHSHYYLMFSPAVALLCGVAAERLERAVSGGRYGTSGWVILVATLVLFSATIQGLIAMRISLDADPYPDRMAAIIQKHTRPEEKFLIHGGGWGGHVLLLAERNGLSIWNTEFLENPENLARIQELGYTKLVMISTSPLLTAIVQTNPGQADLQRVTYHGAMTTVVKNWRSLLETEDILILEIPRPAPGE